LPDALVIFHDKRHLNAVYAQSMIINELIKFPDCPHPLLSTNQFQTMVWFTCYLSGYRLVR